jgi:hypothetical protein
VSPTRSPRRGKKSLTLARKPAREPAAAERGTRRFVILTGLSGAGKTQAIRALEDLGYFCVDNLPSTLIPTMAELASRADTGLEKVAIVADVRESGFLKQFPRVFRKLKALAGITPRLIFLEADPSTLVRRFSETRRPHPLAPDRSVSEGIEEERAKMNSIRAMADLVLDTSNLTVHELRDVFMRMSRDEGGRACTGTAPRAFPTRRRSSPNPRISTDSMFPSGTTWLNAAWAFVSASTKSRPTVTDNR